MCSALQEELFRMQANVFQALAHPIRIAIVQCLSAGEQCVQDIADCVGAERSNISRHISVLVKADLLTAQKRGLKVFYALSMPCVVQFLSCATEVLRNQLHQRMSVLGVGQKVGRRGKDE